MGDRLKSSICTIVETLIWCVKLMILFVGFISLIFLFKVAVFPYSSDLILAIFPTLWMSLRFWLSRSFLYIIVNLIFFAIVVSSFSQNLSRTPPSDGEIAAADQTAASEVKLPDPNPSEDLKMVKEGEEREEENQIVWTLSASQEDHLFPDHGVTEAGEEVFVDDGSLELTWKAIMEEKVRRERHLKKIETVETPSGNLERARAHAAYDGHDDDDNPVALNKRELTKSNSFNDNVSYLSEISMSQEELERRSEAFIDKVNADIRLQRLKSAQRFLLRHG